MQVSDHPSVEIFRQLGGQRFVAMTGARDFMSADNPQPRLIFRVPASLTKGRGTHFEISLRGDDTYLLSFFKIRKGQRVFIEPSRFDVYEDRLRDTFSEMTGLALAL